MSRDRIIQLGKYYYPEPGGMETHLYDTCCQLKDKFDIQVLVANTKPHTVSEEVEGVQVTRVANLGEAFSSPICPTLPFHLHQLNSNPDTIIQLHFPNPMAHLAYLIARPAGRLVIEWHSDIVRQKILSKLYQRQLVRLLQRADCILATSPYYIKYSPFLQKFADKCVVVPRGINLKKFANSSTIQSKAEETRQNYGDGITLFVGRFIYYKGLETLLEAAKKIRGKILLVGDGPLRNKIKNIIKNSLLEDKVFLHHGVCDQELVSFYHACDVFVLPSNQRSEAFGLVQLEAMACSKPIISTNLKTGVPWVNQHGVTGLVVPVDNADKLAQAVNYLLTNIEERLRLGQNGRRRVLENFTIPKVARKLEQVYEQVLHTRSRKEQYAEKLF